MMTQAVDGSDPLLAFTPAWIKALAARVEGVDVLCLRGSEAGLPGNVDVWTFGSSRWGGRARRLAAFAQALPGLVRRADVVFGHMIPRYVWLAAPIARRHRRPLVFWYVHRDASIELRLATACSARVATAVPSSFPLATRRLSAIGHGIDTGYFAPDPDVRPDSPPMVVQVGRLAPIKHQATLARAASRLGPEFDHVRITFAGGVPAGTPARYADLVRGLVQDAGLASRVTFTGAVPPDVVREVYRRATIAVNLSPEGLFDKSALESMMVETPTVVCSRAFDDLLGAHAPLLRIDGPEDEGGLRAALAHVLTMPASARRAMASGIAARARAAHGLQGMMDRLVALMRDASGTA